MSTKARGVRLAVVDVDSGFVRVLANRLDGLGWRYDVLDQVPDVRDLVALRLNALVVDIEMLGPDGWAFLDRVCTALPGMGLIVCTGRSTVAQRVRGLRFGADDWLTKPCHPEELIARIEAVVRRRRRAAVASDASRVMAGELEIRRDQFQAFVDGRSLDLTRREFELLELLAEANGQVLERERIYQHVWGYAMARGDRSVDVYVRKLRQKLEKASPNWGYIHTHFGVGYRFEAYSEAAEAGTASQSRHVAGEEAVPESRGVAGDLAPHPPLANR